MGSIKNMAMYGTEQEHELTEAEFNYIMNVNDAKMKVTQEYNRVISAFLNYIAHSRLAYHDDNLQFEVDFSDKSHKVRVTVLPKDA